MWLVYQIKTISDIKKYILLVNFENKWHFLEKNKKRVFLSNSYWTVIYWHNIPSIMSVPNLELPGEDELSSGNSIIWWRNENRRLTDIDKDGKKSFGFFLNLTMESTLTSTKKDVHTNLESRSPQANSDFCHNGVKTAYSDFWCMLEPTGLNVCSKSKEKEHEREKRSTGWIP